MYIVIQHYINDPVKWDNISKNMMAMIDQHRLPKGLNALQYLPSVDGRQAQCIWEAESLADLKRFIDRETGEAGRNEYFEVKEDSAVNLPKGEAMEAHAG